MDIDTVMLLHPDQGLCVSPPYGAVVLWLSLVEPTPLMLYASHYDSYPLPERSMPITWLTNDEYRAVLVPTDERSAHEYPVIGA